MECGLLDQRCPIQTQLRPFASNPFAASQAKLGGRLVEADGPACLFLPPERERPNSLRSSPSVMTRQPVDL